MENMYISLDAINFIEKEFLKELDGYHYRTIFINELEKVYVIEDSLILYSCIYESQMPIFINSEETYKEKPSSILQFQKRGYKYYGLQIIELTHNNIGFKFVEKNFISKIKDITNIDYIWFNYSRFSGFYYQEWDCYKGEYVKKPTVTHKINELLPELKLKERCGQQFRYYIIVIEIETSKNKKGIGIFYTNQKPYKYILERCNNWIKYDFTYGNMNCIYEVSSAYDKCANIYTMEQALLDLQKSKLKKQFILENHLKYFYIEKTFDNKDDAQVYALNIYREIYLKNNKFDDYHRFNYIKPENKWITEELVFRLCKKIFKNNKVIYQHRPFFLKSDIGGQMSYDVFISGFNIAIEYQGKQHFEAVEFFGGQQAYLRTVERDKIKKELSEKNGIKLIYINYWEDVNMETLKNKINIDNLN